MFKIPDELIEQARVKCTDDAWLVVDYHPTFPKVHEYAGFRTRREAREQVRHFTKGTYRIVRL